MTMNSKAGRVGKSQLTEMIGLSADAAKSRITQIDDDTLDSVSGGIDLSDPNDPFGPTMGMFPTGQNGDPYGDPTQDPTLDPGLNPSLDPGMLEI